MAQWLKTLLKQLVRGPGAPSYMSVTVDPPPQNLNKPFHLSSSILSALRDSSPPSCYLPSVLTLLYTGPQLFTTFFPLHSTTSRMRSKGSKCTLSHCNLHRDGIYFSLSHVKHFTFRYQILVVAYSTRLFYSYFLLLLNSTQGNSIVTFPPLFFF